MSEEEYNFLKVRRSSRKIHLMTKHSTPLTPIYMSNLPTVNEWEEDSYLANHSSPLDKINETHQIQYVMATSPNDQGETSIFSKTLSPLLVTKNSAEGQSLNGKDSTREMKSNGKQKEDAILEISPKQTISRAPTRRFTRKKLRNLLIKERVDKWVIQQLNNIEEATEHNLVIENV